MIRVMMVVLFMAQMVSAQIRVHTVPSQPKVGEAISVFLQLVVCNKMISHFNS